MPTCTACKAEALRWLADEDDGDDDMFGEFNIGDLDFDMQAPASSAKPAEPSSSKGGELTNDNDPASQQRDVQRAPALLQACGAVVRLSLLTFQGRSALTTLKVTGRRLEPA